MSEVFSEISGLLQHVQLNDIQWEKDMSGGSVDGDTIQRAINAKLLDKCQIVIFLFYSKIGPFTREEYDYSVLKRKKLFLYFKEGFSPNDEPQTKLLGDLFRFRTQISYENKILYSSFRSLKELKLLLFHDLLFYLKEQQMMTDNSLMKIYNALELSAAERRCLNLLVMLPPQYYSEGELSRYMQLDDLDRVKHFDAMKSLERKGIVSLDSDKKNSYKVNEYIRKKLINREIYNENDFGFLIDSVVANLTKERNIGYSPREIENIKFAEFFLENLPVHDHVRIGKIKESLAMAYIRTFGTTSDKELKKASLYLEQLLYDDMIVGENKAVIGRRQYLLADIYIKLADLVFSDEKKQYLNKARELLAEIHPEDFTDKFDILRFYLIRFSADFKADDDDYTESIRSELESLFTKNPDFIDLITLHEVDLFEQYFLLSKNLNLVELAKIIIEKIIYLEEQEYGKDEFRLYKRYADLGEILMINNQKQESISYLKKAKKLAEQKRKNPDDVNYIDRMISAWTSKFVTE